MHENVQIAIVVIAATALIFFFALIIIIYALAYQRRKNKNFEEKRLMQTNFDQALLVTQIEIQEQTLANVSQEIHDNIGQIMILAKLNLSTFPTNVTAETQGKIDSTKQLVSKAIHDLRDLSRSMHGDRINELGLKDSIASELKIIQNTGQFKTALKVSGEVYRMEPQKEMVLFRITQEALNNAVKHSRAQAIDIELDYQPVFFKLTVTDDGTGFEHVLLDASQKGIGLKSMENRAALIGGVFSVHSHLQSGTSITIQINHTLL